MGRQLYNRIRTLGMKMPVGCTRMYEHLHELKLRRRYHRHVKKRRASEKPTVICMLNGRTHHAGLADRLYGILSVYRAARELGYDYRISFTSPFELFDYLIPNKHNWIIDKSKLDDSEATPIFIRALNPPHNDKRHRQLINALRKAPTRQIHVYSNLKTIEGNDLADLFKTLFKPSAALDDAMARHKEALGSDYASVSFRFQQLLGDFTDVGAREPLSETNRKSLISKCLSALDDLYDNIGHKYPKLLVASDSSSFLKEAAGRHYAYVIPGEVAHVQFSSSGNAHFKTFMDLMMIASAKESFLIKTPIMYSSGFPRLASDLGGHSFSVIDLNY